MEKVNCSMCRKKVTHAHKGCNEDAALKIIIGNVPEYNKKLAEKLKSRKN